MDLNKIIQTVKEHPEYHKMGMIASHLGVVRENSLTGKMVSEIDVKFDRREIDKIIKEIKELPGIVQVIIEVSEGRLRVGDEIMAVVVGGDRRDHVFPALIETVNRIKAEGGKKKEFF